MRFSPAEAVENRACPSAVCAITAPRAGFRMRVRRHHISAGRTTQVTPGGISITKARRNCKTTDPLGFFAVKSRKYVIIIIIFDLIVYSRDLSLHIPRSVKKSNTIW